MKKGLNIAIILLIFSTSTFGQLNYYLPTHYYGLFSGQLTSAKASGMGLTTITQDGIETSFYNPASISPVKEKLNVHINYGSGNPIRPRSGYSFLGISYKVAGRLSIGAKAFRWRDNNPVWSTIIGTLNQSVDRSSQTMFGLNAAYEIIPNLHIGVSGNHLLDYSIPGYKTSSSTIMSLGGIYDREVNLIKHSNFQDQKIRVAGSLVNLLMNNKVIQRYEDHYHHRGVPIHLYLGGAYKFSLPIKAPFTAKMNYFEDSPELLDIALHVQYRDVLPGKDPHSDDHKNNTHYAIGSEAWFMKRIAFRVGYYFEKRPSDIISTGGAWVTTNRSGFTWGYGTLVPVKKLSKNKIPFDAEVNFVTGKLLNELGKNTVHPSVFTETNFSFNLGVNIKWAQ